MSFSVITGQLASNLTTGGTLTLQTGENNDGVWISVADTGGGISEVARSQMFEPYFTTKLDGVGMGLAVCLWTALLWARALDLLSLGEDTARSLGLNLSRARTVLLLAMTLATALAVSHTGLIAFVGLVAPHLVRSMGPIRPSQLLTQSAWAGGLLLVSADLVSRWWWSPLEWPVGVLTALIGGLYLLSRLGRIGAEP